MFDRLLASKQDLENAKTDLKQEIALKIALTEAHVENKITEVKSELKQDIAELKGSVHFLTKLFFGSVFLILVDIAISLLHAINA